MILALMVLISTSLPAHAISEGNYWETYRNEVIPYFDTGAPGFFSGRGGVKIAYRSFENPNEKAKLVILPGRTEPIRKYAEFIYDLRDLGFSIYVLEHRGQGESGRITQDSQMQYVESYSDYVADMGTFINTLMQGKSPTKLFLLAHSMGGAIGSFYIMKNPNVFAAAVLSAPMFGINTSPYPKQVAYGLTALACKLGFGEYFVPLQGDYNPDQSLPLGKFTFDSTRNEMTKSIFHDYPETQMGGVSYRWLFASFKATKKLIQKSHLFQIPTLLLQAGRDSIVRLPEQNHFCSRAAHCTKIIFPESQHEIFMERDFIRDNALNATKEFFLNQLFIQKN